MRGPCKNCEMRAINCHSTCSDYVDYKNKLDAINEVKRREWEVMDYSFDRKLAMGVGRKI